MCAIWPYDAADEIAYVAAKDVDAAVVVLVVGADDVAVSIADASIADRCHEQDDDDDENADGDDDAAACADDAVNDVDDDDDDDVGDVDVDDVVSDDKSHVCCQCPCC